MVRYPVTITVSSKLIDLIKSYKEYNPEFNLSRRVEALLNDNLVKSMTAKCSNFKNCGNTFLDTKGEYQFCSEKCKIEYKED